MLPRCYCCGTDRTASQVCYTCIRDAKRQQPGSDFAQKVTLALQGIPQVCLKCGWNMSCRCDKQ